MKEMSEWKAQLREKVLSGIDYGRECTDAEVEDIIDQVLFEDREMQKCTVSLRRKMKKELFDSMRRLDLLQIFVEDPEVTEIMINGKDRIFVEKEGRIERLDMKFDSAKQLQNVIQQIVAGCNRAVNEASPIVDARLPDGSRVNIVMNPVALNGPAVTVRRFPAKPITMEEMEHRKTLNRQAAEFLGCLVRAKYNIFISGGTGSGKTTLLNALSGYIPAAERVITVEDNAELQLQGIENLVRLEARNRIVEDGTEITIGDLIRTSLRMRPDRIIVGEVRGGEAVDMIQAMNTGHEGSMSTGHANSASDMLSRLENMILMGMDIPLRAIGQQLACGIEIVIHLGRLRDGSRRILEIVEILEYDGERYLLNPLFVFRETGESKDGKVVGELEKVGELVRNEKLKRAGLVLHAEKTG